MKALQDENTSLKNRVKELEADKSKAQKSLDDSLKAVGELSEQLELREKNNDGARIVKIGNKSYKILGKTFVTQKGRITVEEIMKDTAELKRMVKIKSGRSEERREKNESKRKRKSR